ncbi:MAG: DUF2878 domain-containing protein [Gammaproteobacteria bacterium]|jgi:hypothetical protein
MKTIIINALAFQAGWLCCVLAGANQLPWLGTLTALLIVAWHLGSAGSARKELSLILIAGGIGAVWDSLLVAAGWLQYPSGILIEGTAPHWIVAMWLLFATTLNVSLRWLKQRRLLASLLGAVAAPAAYYAGFKLGGVVIPQLVVALSALAFGWALLMPLLMSLSNRFDGMRPRPAETPLAGCNARV